MILDYLSQSWTNHSINWIRVYKLAEKRVTVNLTIINQSTIINKYKKITNGPSTIIILIELTVNQTIHQN